MAYEPKEKSGSLFKNDKGENAARPDYRGDIMIEGVVYSLSAWIKQGQKGTFMSLSAQIPREQQQTAPVRQSAPVAETYKGGLRVSTPANFDPSDIPF